MPDRPLIFIDLDGVLNDHKPHPNGYCGLKPECVYRLNRIVAGTGARLVISSAWRYLILLEDMTVFGFHSMLMTYGLDRSVEIEGATRFDTMIPDPHGGPVRVSAPKERGRQIADYLAGIGRPVNYVVIDDGGREGGRPDGAWCDMGIPAAGHPVVWTDGAVGLTDADADRAIAILKGGEHASGV